MRVIARPTPDLQKLASALIDLAMAMTEEELESGHRADES
jgi:hypothetical protein